MRIGFCHHCGTRLEFPEKVFRNDTCLTCGSDVHCCLNCAEYDESAPNHCREPQAEKVSVKDRRNFCDHFNLSESKASSLSRDRAVKAKKKLDDLFKNLK